VQRVEKGQERIAAVVGELKVDEIEKARFAFLDLDVPTEQTPFQVIAPAAAPIELPVDDEVRKFLADARLQGVKFEL
jgi:hypothetical protein